MCVLLAPPDRDPFAFDLQRTLSHCNMEDGENPPEFLCAVP